MQVGGDTPYTQRLKLLPSTDIALLSRLYHEMLEDEEFDVPRTAQTARDRMSEYLHNGETAFLFMGEDKVVGYALIIISRTPFYIHHFYICRDARRQGYGKEAFNALLETLRTDKMALDVNIWTCL